MILIPIVIAIIFIIILVVLSLVMFEKVRKGEKQTKTDPFYEEHRDHPAIKAVAIEIIDQLQKYLHECEKYCPADVLNICPEFRFYMDKQSRKMGSQGRYYDAIHYHGYLKGTLFTSSENVEIIASEAKVWGNLIIQEVQQLININEYLKTYTVNIHLNKKSYLNAIEYIITATKSNPAYKKCNDLSSYSGNETDQLAMLYAQSEPVIKSAQIIANIFLKEIQEQSPPRSDEKERQYKYTFDVGERYVYSPGYHSKTLFHFVNANYEPLKSREQQLAVKTAIYNHAQKIIDSALPILFKGKQYTMTYPQVGVLMFSLHNENYQPPQKWY